MKLFKFFPLLVLLFMGLTVVSATAPNPADTLLDYTLDENTGTTAGDSTPNGNNGTINGATWTTGILNSGLDFDGTNDYINNTLTNLRGAFDGDFSFSVWIYPTSVTGSQGIVYVGRDDNFQYVPLNLYLDGSNLNFQTRTATSGVNIQTIKTGITTNTWYHITYIRTGTTVEVFVNGISEITNTNSENGEVSSNNNIITLGNFGSSLINYYQGKIDEVAIFDYALSTNEVSYLYNSGSPTSAQQYPFVAISLINITANNETLLNNSFFNVTTIDFETFFNSASSNLNQTYFLYNSSNDLILSNQFATNNVNGSFTLSSLTEQEYKLNILAETSSLSSNTGNYTFTIDTTPPTINNSLPLEINSYNLGNLSDYVSCSDIGINGICQVEFQPDNVTYNVTDNVTFTFNGNQTYIITAQDQGGNTATETGTILVNPVIFFTFNDTVRDELVSNYQFGSFNTTSQNLSINIYDLGLGNHTLEFRKFGYNLQNFTFSFNQTTTENFIFNVTPVSLSLKVFDEESPSSQLNFNITINNGTNITTFNNQLDFEKNFDEIPTGELELTVTSFNYSLRNLYINLTPFTSSSNQMYLIKEDNSFPVIFNTLNTQRSRPISDVTVTFYEIINDSRVLLGQSLTDSQGFTYFNLDPLKSVEMVFTKDGYIVQRLNTIPNRIEYTILMAEESGSISWLFKDFNYRFLPLNKNFNELPKTLSVQTLDSANQISINKFKVYDNNNNLLYNESSSSPSGHVFTFIATSQNITSYNLELEVIRNGQTYIFNEQYYYFADVNSSFTLKSIGSQLNTQTDQSDLIMIMIVIYIIAVIFGSLFSPAFGPIVGLVPITFYGVMGMFSASPFISLGVVAAFYLITIVGVLYFERF